MSQRRSTRTVKATVALGCVGALALAACGGGGDDGTDASGKPTVTVQITKDARALPMAEMAWTEDLAEACECTIIWQETAGSSWGEQKSALLAAGEVAEVTIGGYDMGDLTKYPDLFLDLTPEIENMPNVSRAFAEQPFAEVVSQTASGEIKGLPGIRTG